MLVSVNGLFIKKTQGYLGATISYFRMIENEKVQSVEFIRLKILKPLTILPADCINKQQELKNYDRHVIKISYMPCDITSK